MRRVIGGIGILSVVLGLGAAVGWGKDQADQPDAVGAQEEVSPLTDDEVVIHTEDGARLLLPKDWPVERRNGVISPAPIEEYLSMKFGQVRDKFSSTDQRLGALERRLERLEHDDIALQRRLRLLESSPQHQEVTHGDTTQNP